MGIFIVAISSCVMVECWHNRTESRVSSGLSCGGVVVRYAGIWRIRSLLEQLIIFQHALVKGRERKHRPNSIHRVEDDSDL